LNLPIARASFPLSRGVASSVGIPEASRDRPKVSTWIRFQL
jgi:hypothetical protein